MQQSREKELAVVGRYGADVGADGAEEQDFYFLSAEKLRSCKLKTLPAMQVLRTDPQFSGWVVRRTLTRTKAYQGEYTEEYLAVSHRWEEKDEPDPDGVQLEAVRDFLNCELGTEREMREAMELTPLQKKLIKRIKYVWFDFWTLPQVIDGNLRSPADMADFKRMLKNCNMLYLGMKVLIVMDASYLSRFWTQFESWLSYQKATPQGLYRTNTNINPVDAWTWGAEADKLSLGGLRSGVVPVRSADIAFEGMKLYSKLSQMNPAEISKSLKHKDVVVTNTGDKEVQLQRIQEFDAEVRRTYEKVAKQTEEMQINADDGITFSFLTREAVLAATERLKRKQDLPSSSLVIRTLSRKAAFEGKYRDICAVSHRWETSNEPDSQGVQLAAIQTHLRAHPNITLVWFDFSCLPQQPRSEAESKEFVAQLPHVGLLFLGVSVLILLDMSYMSRFWTQLEAWLSMQDANSGITTASEAQRRYTVVPMHNAPAILSDMLITLWAGKSPQEAHQILASPDVILTNQSDKAVQLPMMLKLQAEALQTLQA